MKYQKRTLDFFLISTPVSWKRVILFPTHVLLLFNNVHVCTYARILWVFLYGDPFHADTLNET